MFQAADEIIAAHIVIKGRSKAKWSKSNKTKLVTVDELDGEDNDKTLAARL